ncbi:MAG: hypothetical protein B1H02_07555 [Candidatus Latescibacteria bacterium 4484_107]|nr:MAG: hypothetical protein B1H02_07555 [Candidatus Latescibacteria bacterium 4484_107]
MPTPKRPNILFIFTDEQRQDTMRVYGNRKIKTPNLDKLARESVVFTQAYVTQPVCTPSRSSILTGLYPHTNGCIENNIPLKKEIPTIAEMMQGEDYVKGYFGKWHLGDEEIPQHGFERQWVSIEEHYKNHYTREDYKTVKASYRLFLEKHGFMPDAENSGYPVFSRGFAARLPEKYSKPAFLAGEVCQFIREHRDQPFLIYLNFLEPHMPFFGAYDGMYNPEDIELPKNFDALPGPDSPIRHRYMVQYYRDHGWRDRDDAHGTLKTEWEWRYLISRYWGLVSLVDACVGKILANLSELGLEENTVVVYTSDHGDMMGSHRLAAKQVMYEEAAKVPLLIKIPWLKNPSQFVEHPVSQIDLVPTMLDMLDMSAPSQLQGKSWHACLRGDKPWDKEPVFLEWNGRNGDLWLNGPDYGFPEDKLQKATGARIRTVITPDGWKLNVSEIGEHELFNLKEDPLETRNLYHEKQHHKIIQTLSDYIKQWQQETGDEVKLEA